MPWGYRETKTKTIGWWKIRFTFSWRPWLHLPRLTFSIGGD